MEYSVRRTGGDCALLEVLECSHFFSGTKLFGYVRGQAYNDGNGAAPVDD